MFLFCYSPTTEQYIPPFCYRCKGAIRLIILVTRSGFVAPKSPVTSGGQMIPLGYVHI